MGDGLIFYAEKVLGNGIKEAVGNDDHRLGKRGGSEGATGIGQGQRTASLHIEVGDIEPAQAEIGLQAGMLSPKGQIGFAVFAEHIAERGQWEGAVFVILLKVFEKMVAETAVAGAQFHEIHCLCMLPQQGQIAQKSQHQLGIGFAHHRIAGDVVGHFAAAPGVDTGWRNSRAGTAKSGFGRTVVAFRVGPFLFCL